MAAKSKYSQETWEKIREAYLAGWPITRISKEFGPKRDSITDHARRHGWVRQSTESYDDAVMARLHTLPGEDFTPADNETIKTRIVDARTSLIQRHQAAWDHVELLRHDAHAVLQVRETKRVVLDVETDEHGVITLVRDPVKMDLSKRLKVAQTLMGLFETESRALALKQEGERRAHGFDYKIQAEGNTVDEAEERERKKSIADILTHAASIAAKRPPTEGEAA